ncbi:MAG: GDP-mannose 4,6-dehydratase [Dehalococcoidia bacterium]|nr:GDP-mannose 4,6-dehydratase [Dehalococcoidia bacterium]
MARYLVTGCAGFIASKVAEFLLEDGHAVVGVDNLNDAYDVRLKRWRLARLAGLSGFVFHELDICRRESLQRLVADRLGFDGVINLAARAGVRHSVDDPWVYLQTNVTGTLNLLELCRELEVKKFVLASTSSLYGANNPRPYLEDARTDEPISPYAASKKAAEVMCYAYHSLYEIDVTILRYFSVYGPAGRPDMAPFRFVQWISEGRPVTVNGDGSQSRDFTYVDDIARGTIAALRPLGYEAINLGSDAPVVLIDVIRQIEQLVGNRAMIQYKPRHPADVLTTWADIGKAGKILGWKPEVLFETGLQRLVSWYKDNRNWAKDIVTD